MTIADIKKMLESCQTVRDCGQVLKAVNKAIDSDNDDFKCGSAMDLIAIRKAELRLSIVVNRSSAEIRADRILRIRNSDGRSAARSW